MAAEPENPTETPGAFFLSVGVTGEKLAASLLKFAASLLADQRHITDEPYIANVAMTISIVSATMQNLGMTVNQYGEEVKFDDGPMRILCGGVLEDFEKIRKAVERAVGRAVGKAEKVEGDERIPLAKMDSWISVGSTEIGTSLADLKNGTPQILDTFDATTLLMSQLGGSRAANEIVERLADVKTNIWALAPAVKYIALKKLKKEESLEPEQARELNKLEEGIPDILENLEYQKSNIRRLADKYKDDNNVGHVKDLKDVSKTTNEGVDYRYYEDSRVIDDDIRSLVSVQSMASDKFLDIKELYEAWVIRKYNEDDRSRRTWSLFGITVVKEQWEDAQCSIDPLRMTPELKAEIELLMAGTKEMKEQRHAKTDAIKAALPRRISQELAFLVQDREYATNRSRFNRVWKIVDIKPKQPTVEAHGPSWMTWWKSSPQVSEWTVIIKAGTVDEEEEEEEEMLPSRFEDPFRKPSRETRNRSRNRLPPLRPRYVHPPRMPAPMREERGMRVPVHQRPIEYAHEVNMTNMKRVGVFPKAEKLEEIEKKLELILSELNASDKEALSS